MINLNIFDIGANLADRLLFFKLFLTFFLLMYVLVSFLFFRQVTVLNSFLRTKLGGPIRIVSLAALLVSTVLLALVWLF